MFARARIDVDTIAGYPGQQLRFRLHFPKWAGGRDAAQIILLGGSGARRLNDVVMPLPASAAPLLDSLAGYPPWFVAGCLTIVVAVAIWLFAKLIKWSLYLLMTLVLIGGLAATVWLVFK
jgi:hypothetical protein